jgi:hypothetical protein
MTLDIPNDWKFTKIVNTDGAVVGYAIARPDYDVGVQLIAKQGSEWTNGVYLYGSTEKT